MNENSPLKFLYSNCDCLTQSKISELEQYIVNELPDIMALTEIFPKHSHFGIQTELYNLAEYDAFFSSTSEGPGVVIYAKKSFLATNLKIDSEFKEHVWCNLRILDSTNIVVGAMYRSPNGQRENTTHLVNLLREISSRRFSHLVIMSEMPVCGSRVQQC